MAFKIVDRVKETSTTTGTGNVTLAGAVGGFQSFAGAGIADGDLFYYRISGQTTSDWEMGIGTYVAATPAIARTRVLASSNAGALTNFIAGTKDVALSPDAIAYGMAAAEMFGDGSLGDAAISSGVTTAATDLYYRNPTISGTGQIALNGFWLFWNGTLDITSAPAAAINCGNGPAGGLGGATGTAGTGGAGVAGLTAGAAGNNGGAGGAGTTTNGAVGSAGTGSGRVMGGTCGASGAGGAGGGGTGGTNRGSVVTGAFHQIRRWQCPLLMGASIVQGGVGGPGGGSGAGSGSAAGPGGGGGGAPGGVGCMSGRFINRGASTAVGAIQCKGGNGGQGGTSATATCGGGGAGAPGGGGGIFLAYQALLGSTATNAIDTSGGNGALGGAGNSTGTGGNGSQGAAAGAVMLLDIGRPENSSYTAPSGAGTAGGAGSVTAGGSAGVGVTQQVSL